MEKVLFLIALNILLLFLVILTKKRRKLNNFLILIFSTLFFLSLTEFGYRSFLRHNPSILKGDISFNFYSKNPIVGFTFRPTGAVTSLKLSANGDTIYNTIYTLIADSGKNNLDIHHRLAYTKAHDSVHKEIVFLGCSITFGEGIRDKETFTYRTGENLHTNSTNLSCPGYGTHQVYQLYQYKFQNDAENSQRVFVYSFIPDHILRAKCIYNWNENDPYFSVVNDSLRYEGVAYKNSKYPFIHKLTKWLTLHRTLTFISDFVTNLVISAGTKSLTYNDYQKCFLMMKNMQTNIQQTKGRFIILYWDKYSWHENGAKEIVSQETVDEEMKALAGNGVDVIKVSEIFDINDPKYFIKKEGHPNALANQFIADFLAKRIAW